MFKNQINFRLEFTAKEKWKSSQYPKIIIEWSIMFLMWYRVASTFHFVYQKIYPVALENDSRNRCRYVMHSDEIFSLKICDFSLSFSFNKQFNHKNIKYGSIYTSSYNYSKTRRKVHSGHRSLIAGFWIACILLLLPFHPITFV